MGPIQKGELVQMLKKNFKVKVLAIGLAGFQDKEML
jgi:hypothetical protein